MVHRAWSHEPRAQLHDLSQPDSYLMHNNNQPYNLDTSPIEEREVPMMSATVLHYNMYFACKTHVLG